MSNKKHDRMKLDRQIEIYEDCINRLEESKRNGFGDLSQLDSDLEHAYRQVALLKIRRMMLSA
jgi:hypothetical protein